MSDFLVQHFEVTMAPGTAFSLVPIPIAVDVSRTRVMNASQQGQSNVLNLPAPAGLETRDLTVAAYLFSGSSVLLISSPDRSVDTVVRFSLLSYVGAVGGPNEFVIARRSWHTFSAVDATQEVAYSLDVLGVAHEAYPELTVALTGIDARVSTTNDFFSGLAVVLTDDELGDPGTDRKVKFKRGIGTFAEMTAYYEIIHWKGSNWQVERPNTGPGRSAEDYVNPPFVAFYEPVNVPINDIGDWSHAWIESSRAVSNHANADGTNGSLAYPGGTTALVTVEEPQNAIYAGSNDHGFFVISNPDVYVVHQGSAYGNSTGRLEVETSKLVDIASPNELVGDPRRTLAIAHGYWDELANHASSDGLEDDDAGANDLTGVYVAPDKVRLSHSRPVGYLYEHIQVVQFNSSAEARGDPSSVVQRPTWRLTISSS